MTEEQTKRQTLYCPLLSMGSNDLRICMQEKCAWYMSGVKACASFIVAHNCILDIKQKQRKQ